MLIAIVYLSLVFIAIVTFIILIVSALKITKNNQNRRRSSSKLYWFFFLSMIIWFVSTLIVSMRILSVQKERAASIDVKAIHTNAPTDQLNGTIPLQPTMSPAPAKEPSSTDIANDGYDDSGDLDYGDDNSSSVDDSYSEEGNDNDNENDNDDDGIGGIGKLKPNNTSKPAATKKPTSKPAQKTDSFNNSTKPTVTKKPR